MKTLLTFFAFTIGIVSMGQSQFDQRLLSKYSEERIAELNEKQPSTIEYWTYYLDHSYTIVDGSTTGKMMAAEGEINIKNRERFNILALDIHMDRTRQKTYRIQGTNQYLLLKSNDQFSKEFSRNRTANL